MDSRFLEYYNRELAYIREMGKEFSLQYPKIAGRLGIHGVEVADPYVERLLEGFSFLTARIHLKMDAEFPQFTQRLLEVVYPSYVAPLPSMAVGRINVDLEHGSLTNGYIFPKGEILSSHIVRGTQTRVNFSTAQDVLITPFQIQSVDFTGVPPDIPLNRLNLNNHKRPVLSSLRIRFAVKNAAQVQNLKIDQLMLYLSGQDIHTHKLLEIILAHTVEVLCHDAKRPMRWMRRLGAQSIRHEGFDSDQSLLPIDERVFQGYRIIEEYFAMPSRFMFFSVNGLKKGLSFTLPKTPKADDKDNATPSPDSVKEFELTFLFDQAAPELEGNIGLDNVLLHCVPLINLFTKTTDRVEISANRHEYHLLGDRGYPRDFEIYSIEHIEGYSGFNRTEKKEFRSLYRSLGCDSKNYGAYYSIRREPRVLSDTALRNGSRTSYVGSEVFLSIVDQENAPYEVDLTHITATVKCTNRDLPLLLQVGTHHDLTTNNSAPIGGATFMFGPTRPRPAIAADATAWHLISHLGINYLNLMDLDEERGAETLREMLRVYAKIADSATSKQIDGIRSVRVEPTHHRLPVPGPIAYGRGARITVELDESAFSGISPYLFGAVIEQFFSRHVSINMMTELVLKTQQRGEIARWKPRMGKRPSV